MREARLGLTSRGSTAPLGTGRRFFSISYSKRSETCGEGLQNCNGHFGHVRLALPAFHIGYLKLVIAILQEICKGCARVLLTEEERRAYLKQLRKPNIDNLRLRFS